MARMAVTSSTGSPPVPTMAGPWSRKAMMVVRLRAIRPGPTLRHPCSPGHPPSLLAA
jgi:hypothetical protein